MAKYDDYNINRNNLKLQISKDSSYNRSNMKQIKNATVSADLFYLVLAYLNEADVVRTKPLHQTEYDEFKQLVDDAVKYFIGKSEQSCLQKK